MQKEMHKVLLGHGGWSEGSASIDSVDEDSDADEEQSSSSEDTAQDDTMLTTRSLFQQSKAVMSVDAELNSLVATHRHAWVGNCFYKPDLEISQEAEYLVRSVSLPSISPVSSAGVQMRDVMRLDTELARRCVTPDSM